MLWTAELPKIRSRFRYNKFYSRYLHFSSRDKNNDCWIGLYDIFGREIDFATMITRSQDWISSVADNLFILLISLGSTLGSGEAPGDIPNLSTVGTLNLLRDLEDKTWWLRMISDRSHLCTTVGLEMALPYKVMLQKSLLYRLFIYFFFYKIYIFLFTFLINKMC